jgi:hypothetical protein
MKKELLLHAVFPLFLLVVAEPDATADDTESRISILQTQISEASTRTVHGNYGAKTASASPHISGENWFFTGDMLWWHVDEGGNDYAQLFKNTPGSTGSTPVKNRQLDFKWDYGFRAGIGTTFQHDKWDLYLNFTWFRTDNSSASSLHDSGAFLSPLTVVPPISASQVKVHWNIHFYDFALNLGRHYFISSACALHPYFGIKTAFISQIKRSSSEVFSPFFGTLTTKDKNGFWGVGPDIGIEGKWFVISGFNLFGSAGGAILWGDFDVSHKEYSPSFAATRYDFHLDTHQIVPMTQFQLGMGYETNVYHNRYHIAVNARYEYQYWWRQNQMPSFTFSPTLKFQRYNEDLSLQGITVDVRFDF